MTDTSHGVHMSESQNDSDRLLKVTFSWQMVNYPICAAPRRGRWFFSIDIYDNVFQENIILTETQRYSTPLPFLGVSAYDRFREILLKNQNPPSQNEKHTFVLRPVVGTCPGGGQQLCRHAPMFRDRFQLGWVERVTVTAAFWCFSGFADFKNQVYLSRDTARKRASESVCCFVHGL